MNSLEQKIRDAVINNDVHLLKELTSHLNDEGRIVLSKTYYHFSYVFILILLFIIFYLLIINIIINSK